MAWVHPLPHPHIDPEAAVGRPPGRAPDRSFAWDYIMLSGKATNMGRKKATALGVPEDMPIGEETLKGKRATVHCIVEEYNGEEQLKVDINATEWCGYEPEAQPYNEAPDAGRDEGGSAEDILFPEPPGGNPWALTFVPSCARSSVSGQRPSSSW